MAAPDENTPLRLARLSISSVKDNLAAVLNSTTADDKTDEKAEARAEMYAFMQYWQNKDHATLQAREDKVLAELGLTGFTNENCTDAPSPKFLSKLQLVKDAYLTSESWTPARAQLAKALEGNRIDNIVVLGNRSLFTHNWDWSVYTNRGLLDFFLVFAIADQTAAKQGNKDNISIDFHPSQTGYFYPNLPGDERIINALGAKVVHGDARIDERTLVYEMEHDREETWVNVLRSGPGIYYSLQQELLITDPNVEITDDLDVEDKKAGKTDLLLGQTKELQRFLLEFFQKRQGEILPKCPIPELVARDDYTGGHEGYGGSNLDVWGGQPIRLYWIEQDLSARRSKEEVEAAGREQWDYLQENVDWDDFFASDEEESEDEEAEVDEANPTKVAEGQTASNLTGW